MPEHDCLPPDVVRDRLRRAHGADVRPATRGRPRADRRGAAPRRPVRGALPADRRLLDRHEAAGQAGPGAGPRPAAAAARRADERARSGRPRRDARPRPADRHASSGSRSSSPVTCSARSSGCATYLVAIDAGQLLRAAPLGRFTRADRRPRGRGRGRRRTAGRRPESRRGWRSSRTAGWCSSRSTASGPTTSSATRSSTWGCRSSGSSSAVRRSRTCSATSRREAPAA